MGERDWVTRAPEPGETLAADGIAIRCRGRSGATLVSGDLDAAIADLAPSAPMLGLMDEAPTPPFALRIARDRALLCTQDPLSRMGWNGGFAASAADDLFSEIAIAGRRAPDIVAACMSGHSGSPSAATLFAGYGALVAGLADGVSVRIQAPDAAAVWAHLKKLTEVL